MNSPFKRFLNSGLFNESTKWGKESRLEQISWRPKPHYLKSFNKWSILNRLHAFYDIHHPVIQGNHFIQSQFTQKELDTFEKHVVKRKKIRKEKEKCTMVITVYDRFKFIKDRLSYYERFSLLKSIIVVWNNPSIPIPTFPAFKIPVIFLKQEKNSLNNRFIPRKEINTDCIINMDDDYEIPLHHLTKAVRLWKNNRDRLIGYKSTARSFKYVKGKYSYRKYIDHGIAIVLPPGLVYHRKYLHLYNAFENRVNREYVDETMNCDDILFNFVVSNVTNKGPLVVDAYPKAIKMNGLWKRKNHFEQRHECLNVFATNFKHMPLVMSL
jgi:alpha-1,4-N-acetylglucosaminyltransferase EXTL3